MLFAVIAGFAFTTPSVAQENEEFAYISLPPMFIAQSSEQTVITVTLVVPSEQRARAEALKQRLADALRDQIKLSGAGGSMMQGEMLDLWHIKVSLLTAAKAVAPPGLIRDIQLTVEQGRT
jgi:hypothetical protein